MAGYITALGILRRAGNLLLHPVSIALGLTVVIAWLFLPRYDKYKIGIVEEKQLFASGSVVVYDDLDNNGYSDKIEFSSYANRVHFVSVLFEPTVFFQEWDLPGQFTFTRPRFFITGDREGDGKKELYVFTMKGDSVLMHAISELFSEEPVFNSYFITRVGSRGDTLNTAIITAAMDDLNEDGSAEVIFAVNTGFTLVPRTVYAFDIRNRKLMSSPTAGYHIMELRQADVTGDGKREIIVNGYASQNYKADTPVINDKQCWMIVLGRKLDYLFPPVPFADTGYSTLLTWTVPNRNGHCDLYSFYAPPLLSKKPAKIYQWQTDGKLTDSLVLPDQSYQKTTSCVLMYDKGKPCFGIGDKEGLFKVYDTSFRFIRQFTTPYTLSVIATLDLDGDQDEEDIVLDQAVRQLAIYNGDLDHPAVARLALEADHVNVVSLKKVPGKPPLLFIISGRTTFLLSYGPDPLFYLRWGIYAGIFIFIYLFILLIRRIQSRQIAKRLETEKTITDLQLKVVRNQMDPHFTMNAINSVIAAVQCNDKESATQSLVHFSRMYRALVLSGDKIERTLAEEIEFSRNYIELEKFRCGNSFSYSIEIEPEVSLDWKVPKMIIQSPVENAIRHGLLPKSTGGKLTIRTYLSNGQLVLEVEDNGVGRAAGSRNGSTGTGKGLKIMDEFLELYRKIHKSRIHWEVVDLRDEAGNPAGTKVVLRLMVSSKA